MEYSGLGMFLRKKLTKTLNLNKNTTTFLALSSSKVKANLSEY